MKHALPNPFEIYPNQRFALDEKAFLDAIEDPPAFINSPREEYLRAVELIPIVKVIQEFAR